MQETWVRSLVWEGPWRRKQQPIPLFLPGKIPLTRGPDGLQSTGPQKSQTLLKQLSKHACIVDLQFIVLSFCYCSVTQLCLTLCNPTDCSTPGFPVFHHLLKFAQTHVHWVSDTIQRSCSLSSPSPTFNMSQHQGLFQ